MLAPLLLLHGFGGGADDWRHVFELDALARKRQVIRPDSRGRAGATARFRTRDCADDVLALLDALGVARVKAIGLSLGGNTLLHVATIAPARIEAMVLVSATMDYGPEARAIMRASEHPQPRWWAESTDDLAFDAATLARVTARTRVVHGDRDPLYPVELGVALFRAIPGAELEVVPGGGHGPIFGERAPAFARDALAFLDEARDTGVSPA